MGLRKQSRTLPRSLPSTLNLWWPCLMLSMLSRSGVERTSHPVDIVHGPLLTRRVDQIHQFTQGNHPKTLETVIDKWYLTPMLAHITCIIQAPLPMYIVQPLQMTFSNLFTSSTSWHSKTPLLGVLLGGIEVRYRSDNCAPWRNSESFAHWKSLALLCMSRPMMRPNSPRMAAKISMVRILTNL